MKLQIVRELQSRISDEEKVLYGLRQRAQEAATTKYSDTPRAKSQSSKVEFFAAEIADCERRLESLRADELEAKLDLILQLINRVKDFAAQEVLLLRYADCLKWKDISDRLGKSLARVWQLHRRGVAEFTA